MSAEFPDIDLDNLQFACCFCGDSIEKAFVDPCALVFIARWDRSEDEQASQQFWCHAECFERAAPNAEMHVTRPEFYE